MQLFPRLEFEQLVRETKAEPHARGVTCWGQFGAMVFDQLGRATIVVDDRGDHDYGLFVSWTAAGAGL